MNDTSKTYFAPQLHIKSGVTDISFYEKAFGAIELRRFTNDDNSIHVAELSIEGSLFHLHEEKLSAGKFSPQHANGVTALIGLFVPDVDIVIAKAIQAGATLLSPAQSYDYGYRQGQIRDPFGHVWLIEMKI
ncbi:MAG: bleomycin resistance protein [Chitinophagaceae bacterium]|nr:bleomycin resistance protein [Chitinophagaceae bacterium]